MILAVIGAGKVGSALANGLQKSGHQVILAHDDPNNDAQHIHVCSESQFASLPVYVKVAIVAFK